MALIGQLSKLQVSLKEDQAHYTLILGGQELNLNQKVGQKIRMEFQQKMTCISCQLPIKKTYNNGYCFRCYQTLAECDLCILKPETCHFHKGTCRDESWAKDHCFQPHYVYLAHSTGVKVGITRASQIPTRWIDQGALQAFPIVKVLSRFHSGLFEKAIAQNFQDKTNWRKMLLNDTGQVDLIEARKKLFHTMGDVLDDLEEKLKDSQILENEKIIQIKYPVLEYPKKIISLDLDKNHIIEGQLQGIKAQYLILDTGVINIRKYSGYHVEVE